MSAFIVETETIDRIVTWVDGKLYRDHPYLYSKFGEAVGVGCRPTEWQIVHSDKLPNTLGQKLAAMNAAAVDQRYEERNPVQIYRWKPARQTSPVQVLKSLQCLLYQCSEGDVPERPLYKVLEDAISYLAQEIVRGMPEYERVAWA